MDREQYLSQIKNHLDVAVEESEQIADGNVADYIPELANVDTSVVGAAIRLSDGTEIISGNLQTEFTLQSVAKLIVLIGLMEEHGDEKIFSWINAEPTGFSFSSIAQVDRYGPIPSNPMVNAGAIALCSHIPGDIQARALWLDQWAERLFGAPLAVNGKVFASERATGDRNRAIAYLLKSNNVLKLRVDDALETYYYLCSYQANVQQSAFLPMLLANGGVDADGKRIISERTSNCVVSIMATCGLYNESGMHLVQTGMPAKSGVAGLIVAVATGRAGIAAYSPLLNSKGGSVRGHYILAKMSREMDWHFAAPWGYLRLDV